MARPRSEDKRTAILEAATEVVAVLGVGAPTAKIAKGAGVAEGTLFTYFATKDDLPENFQIVMTCQVEFLRGRQEARRVHEDIRRSLFRGKS